MLWTGHTLFRNVIAGEDAVRRADSKEKTSCRGNDSKNKDIEFLQLITQYQDFFHVDGLFIQELLGFLAAVIYRHGKE